MRGQDQLPQLPRISSEKPPSLPPIGAHSNPQNASGSETTLVSATGRASTSPQLPPLRFGRSTSSPEQEQKKLTPITEHSNSGYTNGRTSTGASGSLDPTALSREEQRPPVPEKQGSSILDVPLSTSPPPLRSPRLSSDQPPSSNSKAVNVAVTRPSFDSSRSDRNVWDQSSLTRPRGNSIGAVSAPSIQASRSSASENRSMLSENRPKSPSMSVLTSPHSIRSDAPDPQADRASILTSPHSPRLANAESVGGVSSPQFLGSPIVPQYPAVQLPVAQHLSAHPPAAHSLSSPISQEGSSIFDEAGALFYMQQLGGENSNDQSQARIPTTIPEQDDESSAYSHGSPTAYPSPGSGSRSPPVRQNTPMAVEPIATSTVSAINLPTPADRVSPTSRPGLGRKPSGAREQAMRSFNGEGISSSPPVTEEEEDSQSEDHSDSRHDQMDQPQVHRSISSDDPNLDALAALSYLDVAHENPTSAKVEPLNVRNKAPSPPPVIHEPEPQYKSSFAPSKQATERKAKVQAQQAAHHAATHKPGRANGNKRKSRIAGAWNESSDEEEEDEEEEEEEDDDDVDSDTDPSQVNKPMPPSGASLNPQRSVQGHAQPGGSNMDAPQVYAHARPPRTLPQPPGFQNYCKCIYIVTYTFLTCTSL
jgi:CCR4-NOT transcriptional complex subunit CAF120